MIKGTVPQIPFTLLAGQPTLKDVLDLVKKEIYLSLNCHAIGTIQSFDSAKQVATVTINYKQTRFQLQPNGSYAPVYNDYPLLLDCPVVILGGGTCSVTFPISSGDECLVLFNDRDMDNWWASGQSGAPVATPRLHSTADAIALVGIRSQAHTIASYDTSRAVLKNGDTMVGVGTSLVKISNDAFQLGTLLQNLMTELQSLVTNIETLTVTCASPGDPSSPPINVASFIINGTNLSTIATKIGLLLE